MARITTERRQVAQLSDFNHEDMKGALPVIPCTQKSSTRNFKPPETIQSDFKRLLEHDVPYTNFTFDLIHDWFDHMANTEEHCFIRAQQTPIDWKSKIGNSDMSTNFKVAHDTPVYKGDMAIREDGQIYLLNWMVQNHPNNQATQSILCNAYFTIVRDRPERTDENGYLTDEAGLDVIVPELPGTHTEYAGRPDFALSQGAAGILPDHLITVSLQWNQKTKDIRIGDYFELGGYTYRIVNVSMAEVDINREHGVLLMNARRAAGGKNGD